MTLLAVKGLKAAAFDTVELTLEGKTSAFDLSAADSKKAGEEGEVVRGVLSVFAVVVCGEWMAACVQFFQFWGRLERSGGGMRGICG